MSIKGKNSRWLDYQIVDPSLKYDYKGNEYSLFIGGLNHDTSEDDIVKKIENIGVLDIIDVKLSSNKYQEKYAEVSLFSKQSVETIKESYTDKENVFSYNKSSKYFYLYKRLL